ncbi:hypothetical protein RAS1_41930 [Phycisphaerae bacterium RAS1]|nr:hypothetical protein RAS1_41930 [Phycisphaerae bacterium RAS1]
MPSTPAIELKRHYRELSAEHATEVVGTVADLIVNFIKSRSEQSEQYGRHAPAATPRLTRLGHGHGNGELNGTGS